MFLNNKLALMLYFIVGLIKERNLFLFIFFKLFMYFRLLIIYKNNKKKEKYKKSLQIKYIKKKTYELILFINIIN